MIRPPFLTPNWSDAKAYCQHCSNSGMVVIDGYQRDAKPAADDDPTHLPGLNDTAAPCPMCERGRNYDAAGWNLAYDRREHTYRSTGEGSGWWTRHDLEAVTWENGLTVRHTRRCRVVASNGYPCGRPATDHACDYHHQNQSGVVGRVSELARSVWPVEVMTSEEAVS